MTTPTTAPAAPPTRATRLTGRYVALVAGRRSKWVVLGLWIVLIAVGGSFGSKISSVENNDAQTWLPKNAQSTKALRVDQDHFAGRNVSPGVVVYARKGGLTADDRHKVGADRATVAGQKSTAGTVPPPVWSSDGQAAYLTVPLHSSKSDNNVLGDGVDKLRKTARDGAPAGLTVQITGQAGNVADYIHIYSGLNGALLGGTLLVVALILLLTYRSPVLWLVPLLTAGMASYVASGVVYVLAKSAGLTVNGQSAFVLTILVLGVGTDYALLLIARYREELRAHDDRHEAMAGAMRRALPAVTASAVTIALATLCLLFGRMNSTRGLGPVVSIGVVVAFLAMTSLLPALLVILGRWVFWPAVPRHGAAAVSVEAQHGRWAQVAAAVGRRPRPIWIVTGLVLAALAFGTASVTTGQTQAQQFTKTTDSVAGQRLLDVHFPAGSSAPADVFVPDQGAGAALSAVSRTPGVSSAATGRSAGGWTHITAVLNAAPDTPAARHTVVQLRDALAAAPGPARSALVGGPSAVTLDTNHAESTERKVLFPLILAIVLIMLVVLLRALVAPLVLLASVVLSFAAAVGTASLLFRALGHRHVDGGLFLFGFLFLVALGVDYTIFLMARAREEVERRGHREGILTGLTVTGGVITSAGLVLAASFCVLAAIPVVTSLQEGLLVAVGVLLDTFLVRSLLVPALVLEIGPRVWLPGPLARASARAAEPPLDSPSLAH
jgi:RND superfamily putative drug exporter